MSPIATGTIIWIIITVIASVYITKYIATQSPQNKVQQNQRIGLLTVYMSGFSMWLFWVCCYLHQMYPLIEPKLEL